MRFRNSYALELAPTILANATTKPLDTLRLLIEEHAEDRMETATAAAICGIDEATLGEDLPRKSRATVERALGRLTLCLFAAMRNRWRRKQGRLAAEFEDAASAADSYFAMFSALSEH